MSAKSISFVVSIFFLLFITPIELKADEYSSITDRLENSKISFDKKYNLLEEISGLELLKQQKVLSILLRDAKRQKKDYTLCELYSRIAHNDIFLGDISHAKLVLDSATIFLQKANDNNTIALYHYVSGDYYNMMLDETNAHKHYYEAIRYYEQSKKGYLRAIYILHNISFSYIQKKDLSNLEIARNRMANIVSKADKNLSIDVAYTRVQAFYYSILYQNKLKECYLDSAIILDKKVIDLFKSDLKEELRPEEIAYNYLNLVVNSLKKEEVDYSQLGSLVDSAISLASPTDTVMQVNCLWVKGQIYKGQNRIKDAVDIMKGQLQLMNNWSVSKNLVMYADLYNNLAEVCMDLNEYKEAFLYQQEELKYRKQILDNEKYQIISDIQVKYETEKKENQIKHQEQIIFFLSILCLLIAIGAFLAIKWKRVIKLVNLKQKTIVKLQKSEAKLQMQNEEARENIQEDQNILVRKVSSLVREKLLIYPDDQKKYLDKLETIDRDSIFILKNRNFNDLRIQYCICFGIGMKKEHISLCYNIVDQTIRKHRSTIKADLELEKDDDLNMYLIDLFNGNIY
ncbi:MULTISPECIES: hypothetical protein [unclassified Dysgonomonas]|nr:MULTISPECIES: hypothetical protein [unclassified Dysgonomonas]OJX56559.1 MAG: hypothetical protein BGO84_03800 [Dysgonomonas sp. 37-18]